MLMRTASINLRRAGAGLALAAVLAALAGATALPAAADTGLAPAITDPFDGVVFHDVPSIAGTGEPGSTASIADGHGTPVCSAPIDELGNFSCTGTERLPAGPNELFVSSTSPDGATTVGNTVQVLAEYFPIMSDPVAGALISTLPAFSGRALPGSEVRIVTADGTAVCTTVSDDVGLFQCLTAVPFPAGPLTLAPSMTTAEGAAVLGDTTAWTVVANPSITSPADGGIVGDLPVFAGTAHPGSDISILHGRSGAVLCTAKVGAGGTFNCPVARKLMVGSLPVVPLTSANGVGSVMGTVITLAVEVTPVIVRPAAGGVVPSLVVVEGTAGAFSTVAVLNENNKAVCTDKADENGAFGCVASAVLSPGEHTLTPVQTGLDGIAVKGATVHVTVPGTIPGGVAPATTAGSTAPATTSSAVATEELAATGAGGPALPMAGAALLLILGAAALAPSFRRRTHG